MALPLFGFAATITYFGVAPDRGVETISTVTPNPVEELVLPEQTMSDVVAFQEVLPTVPLPVQKAELLLTEVERTSNERLEIAPAARFSQRDSLPKPIVPEMAVTPKLRTIPTFDLEEL